MLACAPRLASKFRVSFHRPLTVQDCSCRRAVHGMAAVNGQASMGEHKPLNDVFTGLPTTIFTVMTNLAIKHQTINLGQGFPDEVQIWHLPDPCAV